MADNVWNRREFCATTLAGIAGLSLNSFSLQAKPKEFPPHRVITKGPKHHWFGYYDKHEFDPTNRVVLGMEVDFEHRSPTPDDQIKVGMVDLQDGDKWIEFGSSNAWGWQQGCMLQWLPGSESKIIWNDRGKNQYISHILDIKSGDKFTIPSPVYSVTPDGKFGFNADFRRIDDVRPGYGYSGFPDPHKDELAPSTSGIFRVNLETGEEEMIISLKQIKGIGTIPDPDPKAKHYVNHILCNPFAKRFIFLHRWQYPKGHRKTRMMTANYDGSDIRVVDDNGLTSHFIWKDASHILAFSKQKSHGTGFYLFEDGGENSIEIVGIDDMKRDGHCTYLPNTDWILNDTYPNKHRMQIPYLYHVPSRTRIDLGHFLSPKVYTGEWRIDTHPRISRDGKTVIIDSSFKDQGRQLHLIDISEIVG
jgi:hypothetical protein